MATPANVQIKVQGLETIPSLFQGIVKNMVAELNSWNYLEQVITKKPLASLPYLNYASSKGGTEFYTDFDRSKAIPGDEYVTDDAFKPQTYASDLTSKTDSVKIETEFSSKKKFQYWDLVKANPEHARWLLSKWTQTVLKMNLANFRLQIINLVSGGINKAPTNGTDYTGQIRVVTNSKLGADARTIDEIRTDYDAIFNLVDKMARQAKKYSFFPEREDFYIFVSPKVMRNLSKVYERYTGWTVEKFVKGGSLAKLIVNGLTIIADDFLGTYEKFDHTKPDTAVHMTKDYDTTKIDALIVYKRAVFPKIWTFGEMFTESFNGDLFLTMRAKWGLHDSLIRPWLVGYFTQNARKTTPNITY